MIATKDFAEHAMDTVQAEPQRTIEGLRAIVMCALRRPDVLKNYPKLMEEAKDIIAGIRSGWLSKPNWWDAMDRPALR